MGRNFRSIAASEQARDVADKCPLTVTNLETAEKQTSVAIETPSRFMSMGQAVDARGDALAFSIAGG